MNTLEKQHYSYINDAVHFDHFNMALGNKTLIMFGAGKNAAELIITCLENYDIAYICDNYRSKWGTMYCGLEIKPPSKLFEENKSNILVLVTSWFHREITAWLLSHGIMCVTPDIFKNPHVLENGAEIVAANMNKINQVVSLLADEKSKEILKAIAEKRINCSSYYSDIAAGGGEYFNDFFTVSDSEIYVDCGTFDGQTILEFIAFTNRKYKRIIAFEPDPISYALCKRKFKHASDKINILNMAVSNEKGTTKFNSSGYNYSAIDESGTISVKTDTLDNILTDGATFIKMDIEGAEQSALLGAEKTIKNFKPKLAVCLYHRPQDLWEIPLLIHQMVPEYKFRIRHHYGAIYGTVLYCTV